MDNENQAPANQPTNFVVQAPVRARKSYAMLLVTVVWIVVAAAAASGVYFWQHGKVASLNKQLQTVNKASASVINGRATTSGSAYTNEVSVGYPLSLPHKKVIITLSLPTDQNVLGTDPNTRTQEDLAAYYSESKNDIIGNWLFKTKGTANAPIQTMASPNQLYVSDMTQWQKTQDAAVVSYPGSGIDGGSKMTLAQKQAFITQLKADTTACIKDKTKGFATQDKVFNVCYTLAHPQAVGGSWPLSIKGYGELNGSPIYLGGVVQLADTGHQAAQDSYLAAFSRLAASVVDN